MIPRGVVLPALVLCLGLAAAACRPAADKASPGPDAASPGLDAPIVSTPTSTEPSSQPAAAPTACRADDASPVEDPAWQVGSSQDVEILPIVMSSLVTVGPGRFLYNVTDADYQIIASPEIPTAVSFYAIERDPESPAFEVEGAYLDTQLGRGLYRASAEFDCAGEWGAEVSVRYPDGHSASERIRFQVHESGTTPAIGDPAPRSDSATATSIEEIGRISTDPDPYPGAYERTVGEVVTAGQPSLVFFATPAFCQTGFCGPTVELVKSVALDYEDRVGFVQVEPYKLHVTENGLQPELDENGRLQRVEAVVDYGIPIEPYLFLVDAEGDVFAKFEGVVGADELRAAIEDALAEAA